MGKGEKSAPAEEATLSHEDRGSDEGLLPALENGAKDESKKPRTGHVHKADYCKTITRIHLAVVTAVLLVINITLIVIIVGRKSSDSQSLLNDVNSNQFLKSNIIHPTCPDMWVWYLGKCYNFSKKEGNWTSCNDICASWNSTLAVIETVAELDFLNNHKGNLEYWIGLNNDRHGVRRWVDGTNFNNSFKIRGDSACAYLNGNGVSSSRCHAVQRCLCSKRHDCVKT